MAALTPSPRGPRVRVIAPEKEVNQMIGGVYQNPMEGFGGRSPKMNIAIGKEKSSVDTKLHRGEFKRASTCLLGKGGRPGTAGKQAKSDYRGSFREETQLRAGHINVFVGPHGAGELL